MTVFQTELMNNRTARPIPLTCMGFGGARTFPRYNLIEDFERINSKIVRFFC